MGSKSFGQAVATARSSRSWSQSELARQAGIAQPIISLIESEDREPSFRTYRALVAAMPELIAEATRK